jgi:hypothetical protein
MRVTSSVKNISNKNLNKIKNDDLKSEFKSTGNNFNSSNDSNKFE